MAGEILIQTVMGDRLEWCHVCWNQEAIDWRKRRQWDFIDLKREDVGLVRRKDIDPRNNWGSSGGGDEYAWPLALEISLYYYCNFPILIIPLFLHFWSFPVFNSYYTHPHAPAPLHNHSIWHLGPRRSIPGHPWSQDGPYLVYDWYQVIFRQVFQGISK